ncbi:MAG: class I adenylate-forming enzyme family protein [Acetobacteraceae bacterium]
MLETVPWGTDLAATVAEFGDAEAVHDGTRAIGLGELAGRAARLAVILRDAGVTPGTGVALSLPNGIQAVWATNALRLAGVAEVGLNAGLTEAERRYCLDLSDTRLVVTSADQADAFRDLGREVIAIEDIPDDPADPAMLAPVPGDAWAKIGFTSGTTGRPKAIVNTHAARWLANMLQRAHLGVMPGPGSRVLLMTPFIHGAGLITHAFHDRGAGVVLLRGVDLPVVLPLLRGGAVDHVFAPPTVLAKIAGALEGEQIGGIRTIFCGTAPLLPALYAKARAIFGPVVRVTYGKSEIVNPITVLAPAATDAIYAEPAGEGVCVGWPGSGVEVEIRDETGRMLAPEAVGEVHLRGRHMSCGHIDATGFHKLPDDGFHATGDLGRIDARGRLHLVGRLADVVKSGGYKIHPDEIERELAGTAGTAAVSIVSLPSDYWGEIIVAVAETDDPAWPDRARAALGGLARYKHPRAFLMLAELPRNPQGKIMRRLIREVLLDRYRIIDGSHPELEPR